jgi:hypothetical protein
MPNKFWVETILTSCYLQNRCAHVVIKNKTLEKVWTGYKPSLNHIKMFGCDSYVHVPSKLRKSLDSKTKVCKLLGCSENVKGYKLYDTQSHKVIVRKDVGFKPILNHNIKSLDQDFHTISNGGLKVVPYNGNPLPLPPISTPNLTPPLNVVPLTTRPQDVDNANNENIKRRYQL